MYLKTLLTLTIISLLMSGCEKEENNADIMKEKPTEEVTEESNEIGLNVDINNEIKGSSSDSSYESTSDDNDEYIQTEQSTDLWYYDIDLPINYKSNDGHLYEDFLYGKWVYIAGEYAVGGILGLMEFKKDEDTYRNIQVMESEGKTSTHEYMVSAREIDGKMVPTLVEQLNGIYEDETFLDIKNDDKIKLNPYYIIRRDNRLIIKLEKLNNGKDISWGSMKNEQYAKKIIDESIKLLQGENIKFEVVDGALVYRFQDPNELKYQNGLSVKEYISVIMMQHLN